MDLPAPPAEITEPEPLYWQTVLRPHRSLPRASFHRLMLGLAGLSAITGLVCVHIGAWPVMGFFGLDVLLLYGAFMLSYRSARMTETLRLAGSSFSVERLSVRGERRHWRFQAFWLQVRLIEREDESNHLVISSHGRSLTIGGFLGPEERRHLAGEVRTALDRFRGGGLN